MIRAVVKLLLLSWAVTVRMEDEFEEPEDARSVPPKMEIVQFFLPNDENEFYEVLLQTNATEPENPVTYATVTNATENSVRSELKEETGLLFKAMEACRENYPSMSNQTFNQHLYGGLLSELLGVKSEASKAALRHCNISEEFVTKLKAKLFQLDIFQDVFVLIPRNNSSESPELEKSTQTPNTPASRIRPQRTAVESNLRLKLGDEWLHIDPKMSHLSHIYLGRSIYPILTEESRVLDKEPTIPSPDATEASTLHKSTKEAQVSSAWMETPPRRIMHRTESLSRQQGRRLKTLLRLPRGLRKNAPKYPESNSPSETTDSHADAPHRLNLLARNSYRWDIREVDEDKKGTERPLNEKEFSENPRYQMIHKLCAKILQHFKKFLKAEVLKRRTERAP